MDKRGHAALRHQMLFADIITIPRDPESVKTSQIRVIRGLSGFQTIDHQ